jgi:TolA-binding protein
VKFLPTSALLALVAASGCVTSGQGEAMQRDIAALQQQQNAHQKTLAEQQARLEEAMQRADRKIDEMQRMIEDMHRAARSTDTDVSAQLDRLVKDVQELRGTLELVDFRLGKIEPKLEGDGSLTARVEALEKQVSTPATVPPPPAAGAPKGKKELLAYGDNLLKQGKVADARGAFREVVKQWPNDGGVADEAYYRLGETYFDEKKCRSALQEYIKVVEKFAQGSYADKAYYKIGLCSVDIGNLEDAKIFFGEIVRNYKKSPLLKDAQKKLDDVQERLEQEAKQKAKRKGK